MIVYFRVYSKSHDRILPNKLALIGNMRHIYLSNVHGEFQNMLRLSMYKRRQPIEKNAQDDDLKSFTFELIQGCPEFLACGEKLAPISIDRLRHSWITKLNPQNPNLES